MGLQIADSSKQLAFSIFSQLWRVEDPTGVITSVMNTLKME